jgi:hypothetical protein
MTTTNTINILRSPIEHQRSLLRSCLPPNPCNQAPIGLKRKTTQPGCDETDVSFVAGYDITSDIWVSRRCWNYKVGEHQWRAAIGPSKKLPSRKTIFQQVWNWLICLTGASAESPPIFPIFHPIEAQHQHCQHIHHEMYPIPVGYFASNPSLVFQCEKTRCRSQWCQWWCSRWFHWLGSTAVLISALTPTIMPAAPMQLHGLTASTNGRTHTMELHPKAGRDVVGRFYWLRSVAVLLVVVYYYLLLFQYLLVWPVLFLDHVIFPHALPAPSHCSP